MKVLVTGGAGYIGSHTCVDLLNSGYDVSVFDNFSNSNPEVLQRIRHITGKNVTLYRGDLRCKAQVVKALCLSGAKAVVHFAGLKAVGDSVQMPVRYYSNNVVGTTILLQAMEECAVHALVFSSSATVYGQPQWLPLTEDHPLSTTNPYGQTKLVIEDMLRYLCRSNPRWTTVLLRYFNPVGAHDSGAMGEDPQGTPSNLMPYVAQVAVGRRDLLQVWGGDYDTPDGTGVRDYIHVMDLARGHARALEQLKALQGCIEINLGTGTGYSVLDIVTAFEQTSGKKVPYRIAPRRSGDVAICYADVNKALQILGWKAERTLNQMCSDAWCWQSSHPFGYAQESLSAQAASKSYSRHATTLKC
ncbi:UDP-glucose 4-epimerase GalE [Rhodoferax lacus]|uniref:UDP-glucose 4-epimerase n=1 Tax=Rhodoferax lacus TaxID=2184758 RepID=A0A3E1R673_9BURK|nr:UDP-glucose 4-epimerase GalE [Rhodoferax lacus]RFO94878.1 UDP-glucose 4-epimerase GalE [Rhodoferax lacus]